MSKYVVQYAYPKANAPGSAFDPGARCFVFDDSDASLSASQLDRRRARALFALADLVFHSLTFAETLEGCALDFRVMEEKLSPVTLNEAKTALGNQLLNFTLWHFCPPKNKNLGQPFTSLGNVRPTRIKLEQNGNETEAITFLAEHAHAESVERREP